MIADRARFPVLARGRVRLSSTPALSISRQNALIRETLPGFRMTTNLGFMATWRGTLRPILRGYEVRIVYWPRRQQNSVQVYLLSPRLQLARRGARDTISHVYLNRRRPEKSGLCLFDWRDHEWKPSQPLASTIIPWAAEWLAFYELWLMSGVWEGGGHDHGPERDPCRILYPHCLDRQARSLADVLANLGPAIRSSVSWRSMAAVSAVFFLPQSLPRWNPLFAPTDPSPATLISSLAHQRAA
jgi:hypothetical protein